MNDHAILTLIIFCLTLAGLVRFQQRPATVFGCATLLLVAFDLVTQEQLLTSMTNPGLVTLLLLMTCSLGLEKTRLLRFIAPKLIVKSYSMTWLRLYLSTALSSALLNNSAVVATLLSPIRNNPYHKPSKLLLPLSYAAVLGGTLTLVGTSTNLIVNSFYVDATGQSLPFFSFTLVGVGLVVCVGGILWVTSRLLPQLPTTNCDCTGYFIDAKVSEDSALIGQTIEHNGLRHLESLFVVELVRNKRLISPVSPNEVIQAGDRLIFSGDINKVMQLNQFDGLKMFADSNGLLGSNLTEVIVRPESILVGSTLKKSGFRARFNAAVVAIRRDGQRVSGKLGDITIQAGDFLMLAVGDDFRSRHNLSKNFITISGVEPDRQLDPMREWLSIGGFVLVIMLAALGVLPLLKGLLLLLGGLMLSGALKLNELMRRFPAKIWLIVFSALLLSQALTNSGLSQLLGQWVGVFAGELDLYLALVVVYVITWLLTEMITNNAAAALMVPVAMSIAQGMAVELLPFVMTVAFAASASFISPYGYQTNLMVFNAANYRLKHFVQAGLPVSVIYALVVMVMVPWVYM